MQQYVTATVFSATLIVSALAAAAEPIPQTQVEYHQQPQQVYYYQQPAPQAPQQYYSAQPEQRQTFFGRMMDLERRKNQAILRFFGLR
jgi:hypothetical protein